MNVASLAPMALVTAYLYRTAVVDMTTLGVAVASADLAFLFLLKINFTWPIAGGAPVGITARSIQ